MVYEQDIESLFSSADLNEAEQFYLRSQATRLAYTVNLVQSFCDEHTVRRILDVGPHFLTRCIKALIKPEVSVSTLGYEYGKVCPPDIVDEHVHYDLTDCMRKKPVHFKNAPFDLILFCETIEHLFIAPRLVLDLLKRLLTDRSGGLLIQTPNAVSIEKRVGMLLGRNPFELLREDFEYKGHIREYTMDELVNFGKALGLSVWRSEYSNYWPHLSPNRFCRFMQAIAPSFGQGITILFRS
ncbi:MAG: methyltransferase domain-containing protein [Nitrospirota bacterium]